MPLGFFCGGFSSTAGYVSGNEAHDSKVMSDSAPFDCSFPKGVVRFYPNNSEKSEDLSQQSLSASMQGVNSSSLPSFAALKQCVTASVCLSLYRSNARKQFRL